MPELPEVTALADFLDRRATGIAVEQVVPVAFYALKTFDPPASALAGAVVAGAGRRGKFVTVDLGAAHLVFHLAKSGWLQWHDAIAATAPRPGRGPLALRVRLADGSGWDLTEAGTQKRLAVYIVRDPGEVPGIARLGPDPLSPEFTLETLAAILAGRHKQIKGLLTEQGTVAGIGNAYSDEILHTAKLSPFKLADTINPQEAELLHRTIRSVLAEAVDRAVGRQVALLKDEKRSGMRVHGRTGEACPVCGDTIREVSFSASSLQYCPTCQTGGVPLADRRLSKLGIRD